MKKLNVVAKEGSLRQNQGEQAGRLVPLSTLMDNLSRVMAGDQRTSTNLIIGLAFLRHDLKKITCP